MNLAALSASEQEDDDRIWVTNEEPQYGRCLGKYYIIQEFWVGGITAFKMPRREFSGRAFIRKPHEKEDWFPINCDVNYMDVIFDKE